MGDPAFSIENKPQGRQKKKDAQRIHKEASHWEYEGCKSQSHYAKYAITEKSQKLNAGEDHVQENHGQTAVQETN